MITKLPFVPLKSLLGDAIASHWHHLFSETFGVAKRFLNAHNAADTSPSEFT